MGDSHPKHTPAEGLSSSARVPGGRLSSTSDAGEPTAERDQDAGPPTEAASPKFVRLMKDLHTVVNILEAYMLDVIDKPNNLEARWAAIEAFHMSRGLMADAMGRGCPTGTADICRVTTTLVRMMGPIHRASRTQVSVPLTPIWVGLDVQVLRRVVLNLLINALEASPPDSHVIVQIVATEDKVELVFDDAGTGIGTISKTGLGLAFVQQIVVDAGGWLSLRSSQRGGARVTVELPVVPAPPDTEPPRLT